MKTKNIYGILTLIVAIVFLNIFFFCPVKAKKTEVVTPIEESDYSGLYLTGVDSSGGKLGPDKSDAHWTFSGVTNDYSGSAPCQHESLYGKQARTVVERTDAGYGAFAGLNAGIGAYYPDSNNLVNELVWENTSANARWISQNKYGLHYSSAECPDPSGFYDPINHSNVKNSNTFHFKLTENFSISDKSGIDLSSLGLTMNAQTDNLIRVKVNGVVLQSSERGLGAGEDNPCHEFDNFLRNEGTDYICPNFKSTNYLELSSSASPFKLGEKANKLEVDIFSTYSNIGFVITDIALTGNKKKTIDEPTETSCRPIKITVPGYSTYGPYTSSHGGYVAAQNISYGIYINGSSEPVYVNNSSSQVVFSSVEFTNKYTNGIRVNYVIKETVGHTSSVSDIDSPVVYPPDPPGGPPSGGDHLGFSYGYQGPATYTTSSFVCFDYKLNTSFNITTNKRPQGDTDLSISAIIDNVPFTKDDSVWGGFYAQYLTHSQSKQTKWQISILKINPGTSLPTYTRPQVFGSVQDPCSYYGFGSGCGSSKITGIESTKSGVTFPKNGTVINQSTNVPDESAGTKYCFGFSTTPSTSENRNDDENANDGKWSHAAFDPSKNCFVIAKKPKVQVWGGDLFVGHKPSEESASSAADGDISVSSVYKNSLSRTFGSWGEYGIFATGKINNMTSGAALLDPENYSKKSVAGCAVNRLSFVQMDVSNCSDNGHYNFNDYITDVSSNFNSTGSSSLSGNVDLGSLSDGVYSASGALNITGSNNIGEGKSIVIKSTSDVNVSSNITYNNSSYKNIDSIPQVVIIAKNISISNSATNVDGWLIASGDMNTCSEAVINSAKLTTFKCNNRLQINGVVIARRLYLHRTYGAGPGIDSGASAETLNLRADAYLWSYSQASKNGNIITVYTYEAPVRF